MDIIIENHMIAPHLVVALNQGHNIICNWSFPLFNFSSTI